MFFFNNEENNNEILLEENDKKVVEYGKVPFISFICVILSKLA